jgi:hypothetical protein
VDTSTLVALARAHPREAFVAKLPHPFLVLDEELRTQELPVGFATRLAEPRAPVDPSSPRTIEVLEIVKSPRNPYPERVSVGRARNCDVVIRHSSVSKLHAHFHIGGVRLELVDVASQNGTRVNGRPLTPHAPLPVTTGDLVVFGSIFAKLVDAAMLYDLLRGG